VVEGQEKHHPPIFREKKGNKGVSEKVPEKKKGKRRRDGK